MKQTTHDETVMEDGDAAKKVYEIGYVLLPSVPKEKVADQAAMISSAVTVAHGSLIAHGDPELITLAYTMTKKIHGANHRFDEGYFGWFKFELAAGAIASVKKALDTNESVLRYLLMTTVRENTYLGKRAPTYTMATRDAGMIAPEGSASANPPAEIAPVSDPAPAPASASVSIEEMDKSIDAMVKDA